GRRRLQARRIRRARAGRRRADAQAQDARRQEGGGAARRPRRGERLEGGLTAVTGRAGGPLAGDRQVQARAVGDLPGGGRRGGRERNGRGVHGRRGRRLRPRAAGALRRRGTGERDPRAPGGDHRTPAVRVPAPHSAGADRRLPRQRVTADRRPGGGQPPRRAGGAGPLRAAGRVAGRGGQAGGDHERVPARGHRPGRGRHAPEALERDRAGVRRRRWRQAARRDTQQRRSHHGAERPRQARRGALRARRGDPHAAVHLRGRGAARRPLDPDGPQGGRPEGSRRRPARRVRRGPGAHVREHVRARRRAAARGDLLPAAAAPARDRGGPGPDRRRRATARGDRRPDHHARQQRRRRRVDV
ncbi:MAG: Flagellar motor switch protein FliG, partial [uncultured Solirubrobacteraceae bacterium]